jgi:hypothetical protein
LLPDPAPPDTPMLKESGFPEYRNRWLDRAVRTVDNATRDH